MSGGKKTSGRTSDTQRLLDHLAGEDGRIPREALRLPTTTAVPGWRIIHGPHRTFAVRRPGVEGEQLLTRDELIPILRNEWAPRARVALGEAAR